ncbi:ring finger protein [Salix suchowensis]|nr:ring finger protein [Salix suchowensis]
MPQHLDGERAGGAVMLRQSTKRRRQGMDELRRSQYGTWVGNSWGDSNHGDNSVRCGPDCVECQRHAKAWQRRGILKQTRQTLSAGQVLEALERASSNSNEDEARAMPLLLGRFASFTSKEHALLGQSAKCLMTGSILAFVVTARKPSVREANLNLGGRDAVGKKQAKSPARDPLPHFSRKPPWTYTLKPEDPNAAKFDDAPATESSSSSGSGSLPTKHSTPSCLLSSTLLSYLPLRVRTCPSSRIPIASLAVIALTTSSFIASVPLLPCDIPLPPSPLSPYLIPLPLSPITPPGLPYLPSPRSIPLPTSPLLNSVCDSLDVRPDAERPQGSPGTLPRRRQGYCRFEDRCRFLHTLEDGVDEVAHIPAERRENDEFDNQDTEPTSTMRSFFSASIRFSHRGQPSHIVTAFESSRILLANLPFHITRDDVERLVSQFGVVKGLMMLEPTPDAVAALVEFNHSEGPNLRSTTRQLSISRQISFRSPRSSSITLAKTEAAKLGTIRFDSRQIKATFERPRKNQASAYAVKITGLPLNTDRRRLQEFCVGSTSVTIGEPTYVDDSLGPIRELLARHGTLHSLEPVPLDKENTKVVVIAQFLLAEAAASAAFNLNGLTPDIIGYNILSAQHIYLSAYTIPRREYVAIKNEFDAIKAGLGESCRIQCCDHIDPLRLYVYSEDANAYTSAKVQIERLVLGTSWFPPTIHNAGNHTWRRRVG